MRSIPRRSTINSSVWLLLILMGLPTGCNDRGPLSIVDGASRSSRRPSCYYQSEKKAEDIPRSSSRILPIGCQPRSLHTRFQIQFTAIDRLSALFLMDAFRTFHP
ncbi:hypothetical protein BS47DRAFT_968045 [Hydnum rufescens UP504]|uniref:Secreted protein n=1 Tax=Hydnum rufescens UP504 TaxID=1448309 RepID=A0A9P6AWR5_9AGAM|nr:hypothetical protein BS47DRAFT_968045 [Hydnum rufescens UP504]